MAAASSSSSAPPPRWKYNVFTSFHGPDVRKTFLSHLRKQFNVNGISMFDDQGIERGQTIAPALTQAIRESRISIVVLSKNYASSSWCLDELLEIFKYKEAMGQIVMTVFYEVDPSDVRNQAGDFGISFSATCTQKTEEVKRKWSQALNDAGNIAGEHFLKWENESKMIEKIARDVSNKLNVAVSRDFDDMVGLEAHLKKMEALLRSYDSWCMWPCRHWLRDQKVLIILDDVDDLQQLEALAKETSWFGPGSGIILTTKDQELLEQHDINNIYHVDFPTKEEAHKIFCRYAFKQSSAPDGFEKLAEIVTKLCSSLPLGLRVMGSSLRGKREDDWEYGVHVKALLGDNKSVRLRMKTLAYRSFIQISTEGNIVMHKLLQQVGREAVQRQDLGKRQILIDTDEICDVLENDSGGRSVMGISCDLSTLTNDVYISAGGLKKSPNLRFLSIYQSRCDTDVTVHVPEEMDFPTKLRLFTLGGIPRKVSF